MYQNVGDIIAGLDALEARVEKLEQLFYISRARVKALKSELDRIAKCYPEGPRYERGTKLKVPPKPLRIRKRARRKK